ncbi:ATP synthase F1 subunit delta [Spongiivirga sp. MCCC 1A20706]|uniref:ATP synthase F1 subunit delta n=1 Tax=Spongiivirga sp. MCCC 1A20706 TaxID=3160963 RepID=UPI003977747B
MTGSRAAIRYAKALLDLAKQSKADAAVNDDMLAIARTINDNKELSSFLQSPVIKSSVKIASLKEIFPKVNKHTHGIFDVLLANKRIDLLQDVAHKYVFLFDTMKGNEVAKVTTAVPLTKDLEKKVLAKVKELTGKEVALENVVDESIVGGFILRVGDMQYNASIANQLNKLKREFSIS